MDQLIELAAKTDRLLDEAIAAKDRGAAGKLVREARENVVALGRTLGLWSVGSTTSVTIDARRQTLAVANLSTDEIRSMIASLERHEQPALPGESGTASKHRLSTLPGQPNSQSRMV